MTGDNKDKRISYDIARPIRVCNNVIMFTFAAAELVIGGKYQFDCPQQRYIPVYLLVSGVVTLLLAVLSVLPCCANFGNHSKAWSCFVSLFFLGWFIAGNVWIYSIYEPNYDKNVDMNNYCNKTLYLFAFWNINVHYILCGLVFLCYCCRTLLFRGD